MTLRILYTTFGDEAQAKAFADRVLAEELAACVNLVPGVRSLYRWQGALQDEAEVIALVKTRPDLVEPLMALARDVHPYDTPALIVLAPEAADAAFAGWVETVTRAPSAS